MTRTKDVKAFYNEKASTFKDRYTNAKGIYLKAAEDDIIHSLVDFKDKTVLELGMGAGRFLDEVSKVAKKVIGIDISENMVDLAKKRNNDVTLQVMDATKMTFKDNAFDIAYSMGMFEYVENLSPFLREVHRVLKPGGLFVFNCFNDTPQTRIFRSLLKHFPSIGDGFPNMTIHTISSIRKSARKNGFRIKTWEGSLFIPSNLASAMGHKGLGKIYLNLCISMNRGLNSNLTRSLAPELFIVLEKP
ncbi:MAG: class I SAM-dependent methyltransferase [Nanoarchaeota archaeon]